MPIEVLCDGLCNICMLSMLCLKAAFVTCNFKCEYATGKVYESRFINPNAIIHHTNAFARLSHLPLSGFGGMLLQAKILVHRED